MPFFGFFGVLGVLELIFIGVFFILLVIGASLDRRGNESPKWWIFGVGLIAVCVWYWDAWTLSAAWETLTSRVFWEPVGAYLGAGLVYSILEFVLEVRRTARRYKIAWAEKIKGTHQITDRSGRDAVHTQLTGREIMAEGGERATDFVDTFIHNDRSRHGFVSLERAAEGMPVPAIDKFNLAQSIGAWTFFWPAYAVSLVIGDLLTEVFNAIAEVLMKMSGRFVRFSFADVFKV